jgi:hypothetical protein
VIIGISNVHTGDLVPPGMLAVGLFWGAYLGKRLIDLWIDSMRRHSTMDQHAHDAQRLARSGRTHTWPSMVVPDEQPQETPTLKVVPFKPSRPYPFRVEPDGALTFTTGVLNPGFGNPYPADAGPVQAGPSSPESVVEVSHPRHAAPEPAVTTEFPVVDDERALAVVASVSGEDGQR